MTNIFRHIKTLLCVVLAVMTTACGRDCSDVLAEEMGLMEQIPSPEDSAEEPGLFLVCNIGMVGGSTRADGAATPEIELMKSLRIIILDDNGVVETNVHFDFESLRSNYYYVNKLKSRTNKKVYLFANEESVTSIQCNPTSAGLSGSLRNFLGGVTVGDTDFESKVASIYYKPDFSQAIPMSAMYEVEVPEGVKTVEKNFWLVRVANKFTFTFFNERSCEDITVNRFEVRGLADAHFLMPKFTGGAAPVFAGFATWIDWLKDVSDKTQEDPDNPTADQSGWLTGYEIPAPNTKVTLSYATPFTLEAPAISGLQGGGKEIANQYCCESKTLRSDGASVISGEQQYTMHIECSNPNDANDARTFDIALSNIRALFRNTHPNVIVTFKDGQSDLELVVDVVPYTKCVLDPVFGLDR